MTPEERDAAWDERRRTEVIATQRVQDRRLTEVEGDIEKLAAAQREGLANVGTMLDKALTAVDQACQAKVEDVRKEIVKLHDDFTRKFNAIDQREERKRWSRTERMAFFGPTIGTIMAILALVVK